MFPDGSIPGNLAGCPTSGPIAASLPNLRGADPTDNVRPVEVHEGASASTGDTLCVTFRPCLRGRNPARFTHAIRSSVWYRPDAAAVCGRLGCQSSQFA